MPILKLTGNNTMKTGKSPQTLKKKTGARLVAEFMLDNPDCNPLHYLNRVMIDPEESSGNRMVAAKELLRYFIAPLKPVAEPIAPSFDIIDFSAPIDTQIQQCFQAFILGRITAEQSASINTLLTTALRSRELDINADLKDLLKQVENSASFKDVKPRAFAKR